MKKILNFLKEGEKSSSEIASLISKNYYDTLKVLEDLENKNLIEKLEIGKYTYWKLNKEKRGNYGNS